MAWTTTDKASLAFEEALPDDVIDDRDEVPSTDGSEFSETKSYQQQLVDQVPWPDTSLVTKLYIGIIRKDCFHVKSKFITDH